MLDVPMRTQDQRQSRRTRKQRLQMLRGEVVQPTQTIRAGNPNDVEVGKVYRSLALAQCALLAQRITEMPGHAFIWVPRRSRNRIRTHSSSWTSRIGSMI